MSGRTVLDLAAAHEKFVDRDTLRMVIGGRLGIDPDMPFEEFQRALHIGMRVVRPGGALDCGCLDAPMVMIRHDRGCRLEEDN